MKVTENLNLALPVGDAQAFHTPISREVFEMNYRILAATKASLASKGIQYQMLSGPMIATLTLLDASKDDSESEDKARALLAEIKRLTMILVPSANGYDMIPVDAAINRGVIDSDEWREVESSLVFFTCHSALSTKKDRNGLITAMATLLNGVKTSLDITAFAGSSQMSTATEALKAGESLVPR